MIRILLEADLKGLPILFALTQSSHVHAFEIISRIISSACSAGDGVDPWVGKILWRRNWQPTPVFSPGEFMDRGAWQATVHGIAKSWTRLSDLHTQFRLCLLSQTICQQQARQSASSVYPSPRGISSSQGDKKETPTNKKK